MEKHILANEKLYFSFISSIQAIIIGLYTNKFMGYFASPSSTVYSAIKQMEEWNILLSILLILLFIQIWIIFLVKDYSVARYENLANNLLKTACDSLLHPNKNNRHIRAIVTICDYKKGTRKTLYSYNIEMHPERTFVYDIYFGVTGQAIKKRRVIAKAIDVSDTKYGYEENQTPIPEELQCVLAAPIYDKITNKIIGVLAFDSFDSFEDMEFNKRETQILAQSWADIISILMS